jgi:hypothetical protein
VASSALRRIGAGIVVATAVMVAVAGCASRTQAPGAAAATDAAAFPVVTRWQDFVRPIDEYTPSAGQAVALQRMAYATESSCLKQKNYHYSVSDLEPANLPAFIRESVRDQVVRSDLYGFFDTDNVANYGYVRPPGAPGAVTLRLPSGVPQEIASACRSTGQALVATVDSARLPNGGPTFASSDTRIAAATNAWVRCMGAAGISVANPIQAQSDHQTTTADDLRIAQTDVGCKRSTNLVGIALGVQSEYDKNYIFKQLLTTYRINLTELLARAATS